MKCIGPWKWGDMVERSRNSGLFLIVLIQYMLYLWIFLHHKFYKNVCWYNIPIS